MQNNHRNKFVEIKNTSITILMPAFNEELNVGATVKKVKALYPEFEILVVDDGSTDQTRQAAIKAGAKVVSHPYNIGNGAAIKTGLRQASGEWVVMMDADGQHRAEDIGRLLEFKDDYDMVVGARGKGSQTSFHRDLANIIYNNFASYLTKYKIKDLTSGFRLVRLSLARQFIYLLPNTFSYPSTVTMAYLHNGRSLLYVPIVTKARKGKSKIRLVHDGVRFFLIIIKIATLFSPLRVFLPISLTFFLTALGYYLYTFLTMHRFTNMSALLFSSSVIIFMIGLVSEQIAQMRYGKVE